MAGLTESGPESRPAAFLPNPDIPEIGSRSRKGIGVKRPLRTFLSADYHHLAWLIVTVVSLMWNAVYCGLKIAADFRGPKPASGVWGLLALAGVLSTIVMAVVGAGIAASGI